MGGCRFVLVGALLGCGAGGGGGDEDQPPCTFEGTYFVAYELVSGGTGCATNVAPTVLLMQSDEQQCTTACGFADGNPCETTFVCEPGNPVTECAGAEPFRLSDGTVSGFGSTATFCEYHLTLLRVLEE